MKVYTYSEARQNLASLLEEARTQGAVGVRRRDGQMFVVKPERRARSPLDIESVDLGVSTDEIVEIVRESRTRARTL
jgi:PHD/YefM family antitoxin component YafN of YafNO toxin-antitoxin module